MSHAHRTFVCRCEDIDLAEVHEAIREGYDDLESLRRFTALGTGPCQGKACLAECVRILAGHHGVDEAEIGLMTLRPPVVPIPIGQLCGLSDEMVEALLDGEARAAARRVHTALSASDRIRTGRPTPEDVR